MPLDQHIEGGHGEGQTRLKIGPAPMHHLLQMADECQHREHRLHEHAVLPLAALTHFEIARIALRGMEAGVAQDDHSPIDLLNQPLNADFRRAKTINIFGSAREAHGYWKTTGRFCSQGIAWCGWSRAASRKIGLWQRLSQCTTIRSGWISPPPPFPRICDTVVWAQRCQSHAVAWPASDSNHWPVQSWWCRDRR